MALSRLVGGLSSGLTISALALVSEIPPFVVPITGTGTGAVTSDNGRPLLAPPPSIIHSSSSSSP
jgi:hypothetical protein